MSFMFDQDYFGMGLFSGLRPLGAEDKKLIKEMMQCTDPDELKEKYTELYESLYEITQHSKYSEDFFNHEEVESALTYFKEHTDTRTISEQLRDHIEALCYDVVFGTHREVELMRYFPEEYNKKIPKKGGWIMVKDILPTSVKPIQYSVYFAKEAIVYKEIPLEATARRKSKKQRIPYYKLMITTEEGEVHLYPNEYMVINDTEALFEEVGNMYELVRLGGTANYDNAKVHYLSTRGIAQEHVYRMLMGSINSMTHSFFKIIPEAIPYWDHFFNCASKGLSINMINLLWDRMNTPPEVPVIKLKDISHENNG